MKIQPGEQVRALQQVPSEQSRKAQQYDNATIIGGACSDMGVPTFIQIPPYPGTAALNHVEK